MGDVVAQLKSLVATHSLRDLARAYLSLSGNRPQPVQDIRAALVRAGVAKSSLSKLSAALSSGKLIFLRLPEGWELNPAAYAEAQTWLSGAGLRSSEWKREGATIHSPRPTVFFGHGRSELWRTLKDYVVDKLGCSYDEYNREATAGSSRKERLEAMLDKARFALLVLTPEDEAKDGSQRARENVVHELGLFQGRLGFKRAIVVMQEGCSEFSNIAGLDQIRFKTSPLEKAHEVRDALVREGLIVA